MRLWKFARALTVLAVIALVGTWVASALLESRAVLAQRVDPHPPDLALVLGEAGTPIGSPQRLLIFDDRAFLDGTAPDGARIVSEKYLQQNSIYPLQLKTVTFFRDACMIGFGVAALLFGVLWWRTSRPRAAKVLTSAA